MKKPLWDPDEFDFVQNARDLGVFKNMPESGFDGQPIRILDMPIKFPGEPFRLPDEIGDFWPLVEAAWKNEKLVNSDWATHYVYITIDQRPVKPNSTQRRGGWHSDMFFQNRSGQQIDVTADNAAFLKEARCRIDNTYIWTNRLPTRFANIAFPLSNGKCEQIEGAWDIIGDAAEKSGLAYSFAPNTLLWLTPYVVHASPVNNKDYEVNRTFVKIAISEKKFNRLGNTHNGLFKYSWRMIPRSSSRNHPWA